ncbi:ATP-grasp domain-containing protein [Streptomyces chattanoogensis]|uniref:ATP-grasp domain-containing protein n=1 Tax=Streptomyces chattanoogensis TaxID=66876 RepID=UPI0036CBF1EA
MLVVLGAGDRDHHAFSFEQVASVHPVLIMDPDPPVWAWPHVVGTWTVDLTDEDAVAAAVMQLARERGVAGVMTFLEHHAGLAAHLAERLGLPGAGAQAMGACRDRLLSRRLLAEPRVPSARSVLVADEDAAVECAERLGYPVVIKPRAMAGSAGAMRADCADAVRRAVETATGAGLLGPDADAAAGVLCEEYLPGPEISVECVVLGPEAVHVAAITRNRLLPEPRFLHRGHLVDACDDLLEDTAVRDVATRALQALGIGPAVVHVRMRLTDDGPAIVAVHGHMADDHIPLLTYLATGISLPRAAAELALGRTPDLAPTRQHCAGVQFLYPPGDGQIVRQLDKTLPRAWLERVVWTSKVGDRVESPPLSIDDRLAHWVVIGTDPVICDLLILMLEDVVTVEIAPATIPTTACAR